MLPLQITLENFLSYREKVTLSFEGASLWMLAGENGAGKSSVFDAMRWTLFGAHRGGKSGYEALIHTGQTRLRVAFDCALGERRFRLVRTLARAGRATWQIEELSEGETIKIPETDGREGYEKWVHENIGLSDETFTTAMYLAQNRGDAILGASAQQRYEMLAEIVDISAYAALHERAKTRAGELDGAARAAERAWQNAPDVRPEAVVTLGAQLAELSGQIEQKSAQREAIFGLEPLAKRWDEWVCEQNEAKAALETARVMLGDAVQIERDVARLSELETLLPPLERYVEARNRAARNQEEIAARAADSEAARALAQVAKSRLEALKTALKNLESAREAAESAQLSAASEAALLAPRLAMGRQIATLRGEIGELENELLAFPTGLSAQKAGLESDLKAAHQEFAARAIWRRFEREKSVYGDAKSRENAAQDELFSLQNARPEVEVRLQTAEIERESVRETQTRAVEFLATARARLVDAQSARERFKSVQNEADCYFCGQELTPQHREKEQVRLENALQTAQQEVEHADLALQRADRIEVEAKTRLERVQNARREAENARRQRENESQNARAEAESVALRATEIFGEFTPAWELRLEMKKANLDSQNALTGALCVAARVGNRDLSGETRLENAREKVRVVELLEGDFAFPKSEISAESLETQRRELEALTTREADLGRIEFRLGDRKSQLAPLQRAARDENLEALFGREVELKNALETAALVLKSGESRLKNAREAAEVAQIETEREGAAVAALGLQIAALEAAKSEIERALEGAQSLVLASFRGLNQAELGANLTSLQSARAALAGRDLAAQFIEIRAAQNRVAGLETELVRLESALQSVPVEARRAPGELRQKSVALKAELEVATGLQRGLQLEKTRLEERLSEKTGLEKAHLEAQNRARQHRTLADLLGPHQLQRFLLREAENGIVDEANAVLDRISGGGLRLELRADDEEIAGARKGPPKVLDVAIFRGDDTGESGKGMLAAFLSGSQRFRVAVALALGIGRFATRGGGSRLEAVIIDEGFGSLDKIGRGEMIEELQLLGQELQRVILVSHQEEFFEAFPNRYLIEKVDGRSRAHLMGS